MASSDSYDGAVTLKHQHRDLAATSMINLVFFVTAAGSKQDRRREACLERLSGDDEIL